MNRIFSRGSENQTSEAKAAAGAAVSEGRGGPRPAHVPSGDACGHSRAPLGLRLPRPDVLLYLHGAFFLPGLFCLFI